MAEFCDLPEEVVLKIFSYVPQSQLNDSISNVCQRFRRISKDISLYSSVILDNGFSFNNITRIFCEYRSFIRSLVITNRNDTNYILEMVPSLKNLQILKVNSCSGCKFLCGYITKEVNSVLLLNILMKNANLTGLWIKRSAIRPGEIKMLDNKLREIVLKNSYYERSLDERGILGQNNLKVLNLQNLIMNRSTLTEVIFRNRKTLHVIKLDVWEPQYGTNDELFTAIGCCSNIRKLLLRNLSFYRINEEVLIRCLVSLKQLKSIKFSNIEHISSATLVQSFGQLHFKNVQKICLCACDGVNSWAIRNIAMNCSALSKFAFHQPKITEDNNVNADDILFLASRCNKIQVLDLLYTHTSIGKRIVDVVSYLPALQHFKYCPNFQSTDEYLITLISKFHMPNNFRVSIKLNSHSDKFILVNRNEPIIS